MAMILLIAFALGFQQVAKPEATSLLGKPLVPAPIAAEARQTLEKNLEQAEIVYGGNPDDPDATIWLGRRLAYLGRYRDAIETYSAIGYDYAVEKAGATVGWTFTIYEEAWNYGFPQEMAHFVDCVANEKQPLVTGEDGRAVLEAIFAAYESAGTGRKVTLPFKSGAAKPIDLWRRAG